MNGNKLMLLFLIIGVIIAAFIFVENSKNSSNNNSNFNSGKTVVMNVTQYLNDGNYVKNDTKHEFFIDFRSLNPGDILIIKDRLFQEPKYDYDNVTKMYVTRLSICSSGKYSWPIVIYVDKNVTSEYKMGDLVEVTLHIKHYDIKEKWNNAVWHVYGELPEEAIVNGKYSGEIVVPPNQVKKVNE